MGAREIYRPIEGIFRERKQNKKERQAMGIGFLPFGFFLSSLLRLPLLRMLGFIYFYFYLRLFYFYFFFLFNFYFRNNFIHFIGTFRLQIFSHVFFFYFSPFPPLFLCQIFAFLGCVCVISQTKQNGRTHTHTREMSLFFCTGQTQYGAKQKNDGPSGLIGLLSSAGVGDATGQHHHGHPRHHLPPLGDLVSLGLVNPTSG